MIRFIEHLRSFYLIFASSNTLPNITTKEPESSTKFKFTVKHMLLFLIIIGVIFRITSLQNRDVGFDANYFLTMGQTFADKGEFYLPWGDPSNLNGLPSFSHHMSPLYPAYLGSFYVIFGESYLVPKIASLLMSLFTLIIIYWTSKDLFGKERGIVVATIFALDYELIIETGKLYSENMTLLFFALTMWAIIRGVKDDRYISLAGLFAGLAYLTRASLGYFFIIAGIGGFLWRFYYMRWDVFRNKWYLIGIAIFLGIVGGWGLRNLYHFGWPNWETSAALQNTILYAFSRPVDYFILIVLLVPFFIFIIMSYGAFWFPELRTSLKRIKDEQVSGLWLAVFLVPFIALFVSGALSLDETEKGVSLFWRDRVRYLLYAFLPLIWLAVREVNFHLNKPIRQIFSRSRFSLSIIRERISEILKNRLWLFSIIILFIAGIVSLLTMGGWLAAFLFMAIPAMFFRSSRKRLAIFLAVLLVFSIEGGTGEVKFAAPSVGSDLDSMLAPGEIVAVNASSWHQYYFLYPFIENAEDRIFPLETYPNATYIISYFVEVNYYGYENIASYYDESKGGLISEALAMLSGSTTRVTKLTIVLWKHL